MERRYGGQLGVLKRCFSSGRGILSGGKIEKNKRGKAEGIGEMISRSGKENSTESRQSPLSLKAPLKEIFYGDKRTRVEGRL